MFIDPTDFPIVRMNFDHARDEGAESFGGFEGLLDREQPFVVLARHDGHEDHDHAERKSVTLWMKANRTRMTRLVRAMIFVEPNPAKRLALKASSAMFGKFWGYPMLVASCDDEALATARRLLAEENAAVPAPT